MDGINRMKKKRFSRRDPERQREERLGGDTSPYLGYRGISGEWESIQTPGVP